jgi:hypothetical protein
MLSSQIDQQERKEVLRNDQRVREQAATLHGFAQSDAALPRGRFTSVTAENVVGAEPIIKYPQASHPFQSDPCGPEPALGYRVDDLEPTSSFVAQAGESAFRRSGEDAGSPRTSPLEPCPTPVQAPAPPSAPAPSGSGGGAFSPRRSFRRFR